MFEHRLFSELPEKSDLSESLFHLKKIRFDLGDRTIQVVLTQVVRLEPGLFRDSEPRSSTFAIRGRLVAQDEATKKYLLVRGLPIDRDERFKGWIRYSRHRTGRLFFADHRFEASID